MLAQWNARLQSQLTSTVSQHQQETKSSLKQKSHDISSLATELATLKKKLQQTERSHHSLEQANKNVKKDNQDLVKCLQEVKANVKQDEISSLRHEHKERIQAKAKLEFQRGVRQGIENATKNTIALPNDRLDQSTLAKWITEAFLKVDGTKPPHECAAIAANAVWNMYDGQAKAYLAEWSTEMNPYRQAKEIAKVMDMSPGQLNLSGYMELKNKKGKILALSCGPFLPSGHQKSPDSAYPGFFGTGCHLLILFSLHNLSLCTSSNKPCWRVISISLSSSQPALQPPPPPPLQAIPTCHQSLLSNPTICLRNTLPLPLWYLTPKLCQQHQKHLCLTPHLNQTTMFPDHILFPFVPVHQQMLLIFTLFTGCAPAPAAMKPPSNLLPALPQQFSTLSLPNWFTIPLPFLLSMTFDIPTLLLLPPALMKRLIPPMLVDLF
jgi:transposase-like protein